MTSEYSGRQQGWVAGACVLNFNKFGSHGEVKNVKAERTKGQPELKRKKKTKRRKKKQSSSYFLCSAQSEGEKRGLTLLFSDMSNGSNGHTNGFKKSRSFHEGGKRNKTKHLTEM